MRNILTCAVLLVQCLAWAAVLPISGTEHASVRRQSKSLKQNPFPLHTTLIESTALQVRNVTDSATSTGKLGDERVAMADTATAQFSTSASNKSTGDPKSFDMITQGNYRGSFFGYEVDQPRIPTRRAWQLVQLAIVQLRTEARDLGRQMTDVDPLPIFNFLGVADIGVGVQILLNPNQREIGHVTYNDYLNHLEILGSWVAEWDSNSVPGTRISGARKNPNPGPEGRYWIDQIKGRLVFSAATTTNASSDPLAS